MEESTEHTLPLCPLSFGFCFVTAIFRGNVCGTFPLENDTTEGPHGFFRGVARQSPGLWVEACDPYDPVYRHDARWYIIHNEFVEGEVLRMHFPPSRPPRLFRPGRVQARAWAGLGPNRMAWPLPPWNSGRAGRPGVVGPVL